jgi:large subunit ribosomal protein L15
MRLNTLSPAPGSKHASKRLGRGIGSGLGKTSGRGHKGQGARKSGNVRPGFEGGQMPLQKRLPKFGFYSRMGSSTAEVRTSELGKVEGSVVNLESLEKANVIDRTTLRARIMLSGDVTKAFTVEGITVTKGARAAIEAAGGKIVEKAAEKPVAKKVKKAKKIEKK